jgi:TorA maturation chaperone TorD
MEVAPVARRALDLARAYGQLRWAFLPGDARAHPVLASGDSAAQLAALSGPLRRARPEDMRRFAGEKDEFASAAAFSQAYEICFRGARLVSPFETDYTTSTPFEQANELADIGGFYRAFNFAWQSSTVDRVDHIGAELEFLCVLSWMEAKALESGAPSDAGIAADAHAKFLTDHAGRWVGRLAARCEAKGAQPFFRAATRLAAAVVVEDMSSRGVAAKSISPTVLPMA